MSDVSKYVVFRTKWGHFGIAGTNSAILRTQLPVADRRSAELRLLNSVPAAQFDIEYFADVQRQIKQYFQGQRVDFGRDIPVEFQGMSVFARRILNACRNIGYAGRVSYSQLAKKAGYPHAARAVGNALAKILFR